MDQDRLNRLTKVAVQCFDFAESLKRKPQDELTEDEKHLIEQHDRLIQVWEEMDKFERPNG